MNAPRVVVVGGGVSGLTAAFALQEYANRTGAPLSMTLLEAEPRAGGHVHTTCRDGFVVEAGPNGFLDREPLTMATIDTLGIRSRLVEARPQARRRFIVRGGRLCRVPDGPVTLLTTSALSWRGKLRLMCEPFARGPSSRADETVYEFARRRVGHEAAEMLVDAAVSGISGGDSRLLSVDAQFPQMTHLERQHGSLLRGMLARRKTRSGPTRLLSFDQGMDVFTRALAARLDRAVRLNTPLQRVERARDGWRLTLGGGGTMEADHVILAVQARAASRIVQELDQPLSRLLSGLDYAGLAVVAFGYRTAALPGPLDGYGYIVTRAERSATLGVVWESSLFPGRAPRDAALLRVFLGGVRHPEVLQWTDSQVVEAASRHLAQIMSIRATPCHTSVNRFPEAIAQYTIGHEDRHSEVRARLGAHPGLSISGTSFEGVSFNQGVRSGRLLAEKIARGLWNDGQPGVRAVKRITSLQEWEEQP